jgi:PKD repeat protein
MPAPVAAFSGTPLSGVVPISVVFTDSSSNTPTSWAWDFGDSGTATTQNPTHKYVQSGSYTVTLTATNASGSDPEVKAAYVVVTASQLSLVMDGLAGLIDTAGFVSQATYAWPSAEVVTPCVLVDFPKITFDLTFQGAAATQTHNRYEFPVYYLVGEAGTKDVRDALSNILTGQASVKAALDGPHSFGAVRCSDASIAQVAVAASIYVGARFDVEVLT